MRQEYEEDAQNIDAYCRKYVTADETRKESSFVFGQYQSNSFLMQRRISRVKRNSCSDSESTNWELLKQFIEKHETLIYILIFLPVVLTACYIAFVVKGHIILPAVKTKQNKLNNR